MTDVKVTLHDGDIQHLYKALIPETLLSSLKPNGRESIELLLAIPFFSPKPSVYNITSLHTELASFHSRSGWGPPVVEF